MKKTGGKPNKMKGKKNKTSRYDFHLHLAKQKSPSASLAFIDLKKKQLLLKKCNIV
jgi:hypothetical protein